MFCPLCWNETLACNTFILCASSLNDHVSFIKNVVQMYKCNTNEHVIHLYIWFHTFLSRLEHN